MTVRLPAPKAILFDWDNTLVDNWATIAEALNVALTAMGHEPWTLAETKLRVRESMRDSFPRLFGDRWPEARQIFYDRFVATHLQSLQAKAHADATLRTLGAAGLYLGVVSNKRGDLLRKEAGHLGWTARFGRMIGAGDAANDKPAADPVVMALDGTGLSLDGAVWFVGDTAIDIECARAAGVTALLVGTEHGEESAIAALAPAALMNDLSALGGLVEAAGVPIFKHTTPARG
ncbi:MAG: HAD family hydrolase [Alphaproteobacteria bacterium]